MKKITIILFCFVCFQSSRAQIPVLWGLTSGGGSNNEGIVFSINGDSTGYNNHYPFAVATGDQPLGALIKANNGKLYGTDYWDGAKGVGALFSFDTSGNSYSDLYDFDNTHGEYPGANLTELTSNHKLYGLSQAGGANGYGVIFVFDPADSSYNDLYDFDLTNGGLSEHCSLVYNSNGKFYGLASAGGSHSDGVIFSFNPGTNTYADVFDFNGANGSFPLGSLMQASDGKFYGLTDNGGVNSLGVLFSFDPNDSIYSPLYSFNATQGSRPHGSLIQASNGLLYGMTYSSGSHADGVLFSFDPVDTSYSELYDFDGTHGATPEGALIQASDGKLYGMTYSGGSSNSGVVFSFDLTGNIYKVILNFDGTNGGHPYGDLLQTSTVAAAPPPVASFQSSDTNFCANNCINFTDKSTNSPTSWSWTFQAASPDTSTNQNPRNICYVQSGNYNVTLVASNSGGSDTITLSNFISVLSAPPAPTITKSNDTLFCSYDSSYAFYQWYSGTTIINGATDSFLVISQNGSYNLKVSNKNDCSIASGVSIILGLQTPASNTDLHFNVMPNPVSDNLIITGNLPGSRAVGVLIIYTVLGEKIFSAPFDGEGDKAIDIKSLSAGIYFVSVQNDNYKWLGRFIKQ